MNSRAQARLLQYKNNIEYGRDTRKNRMTSLHCWNCAAPIEQKEHVCPGCGVYLAERTAGRAHYEVVGGAVIDGWSNDEPMRLWSVGWWRSFIARHWRGDLPLEASFWGATIILTLAIYLLPFAISQGILLAGSDYSEFRANKITEEVLWTSLMTLLPIGTWQVVGTWRSAGRQRWSGRWQGWGILTRVVLVPYAILAGFLSFAAAWFLFSS